MPPTMVEMLNPWMVWLQGWAGYFSQCSALPLGYPGCHTFWYMVVGFVLLVGFLFFFKMIVRGIKETRGRRSYNKWVKEQQKVADEEVMQKHVWTGDNLTVDSLDEAELAEKFRQTMKKNSSQSQ